MGLLSDLAGGIGTALTNVGDFIGLDGKFGMGGANQSFSLANMGDALGLTSGDNQYEDFLTRQIAGGGAPMAGVGANGLVSGMSGFTTTPTGYNLGGAGSNILGDLSKSLGFSQDLSIPDITKLVINWKDFKNKEKLIDANTRAANVQTSAFMEDRAKADAKEKALTAQIEQYHANRAKSLANLDGIPS